MGHGFQPVGDMAYRADQPRGEGFVDKVRVPRSRFDPEHLSGEAGGGLQGDVGDPPFPSGVEISGQSPSPCFPRPLNRFSSRLRVKPHLPGRDVNLVLPP